MKLPAAALLALALAGCGKAPPPDCAAVTRQWPACFDKHRDDFRAFLMNCIPYDEPERIAGSWVRDFEFEQFYEGQAIPFDQAWQFRPRTVTLLADVPVPRDAQGRLLASVSWVEFEGRRPLCDAIPQESTLIVDRVLSERIVEARLSEWQD